jgi:hypothetical protein
VIFTHYFTLSQLLWNRIVFLTLSIVMSADVFRGSSQEKDCVALLF